MPNGGHSFGFPAGSLDRDRARGALLGLAVGNLAGLPYEGWRKDDLVGETIALPANAKDRRWDDDVAQAILLAEACIEDRLDADSLAERFKAWYRGNGRGCGILTRMVIDAWDRGVEPGRAAREVEDLLGPNRSAPNGAVMRCAPVGIRYGSGTGAAGPAISSCEVTHSDMRCVQSTIATVFIIGAAVRAQEITPDLIHCMITSVGGGAGELFGPMKQLFDRGLEGIVWDGRSRGYTMLAYQAVVWAALTDLDFVSGIEKIVRLGGDTDTNAAVAGAVLGARLGTAGIPERWVDALPDAQRLIDLADELVLAEQLAVGHG